MWWLRVTDDIRRDAYWTYLWLLYAQGDQSLNEIQYRTGWRISRFFSREAIGKLVKHGYASGRETIEKTVNGASYAVRRYSLTPLGRAEGAKLKQEVIDGCWTVERDHGRTKTARSTSRARSF